MTLLTQVSDEYNYAIYFSTHSIELIRGIKPENIFYIERHSDNSLEVLNPCYPAYATKFLYDHSGYDRIILVEDDLAKEIIRRILTYIIHSGFISGYQNRYGDNLKPPTNVYHRMTA